MTLSPSALHTVTYWPNVCSTDEYNEMFIAKICTLLSMMINTDRTVLTIWRPVEDGDYTMKNISSSPCSWRSGCSLNLLGIHKAHSHKVRAAV